MSQNALSDRRSNRVHSGQGQILDRLAVGMLFLVFFAESGVCVQSAPGAGRKREMILIRQVASGDTTLAKPSEEYKINPGDSVDISIFDVPELSHTYVVSPDGTIFVALLPQPVQAAGLTLEQLVHALEDAFRQSGRLQRPEITISLRQSLGGSVAVEGDVKTPQMIAALGRAKLVDVITQCGGLADESLGAEVTITRGELAMQVIARDGKMTGPTEKVDFKKVMDPQDPASQIPVWPGDRVVVEALPPVYYVLGEVKTPGGYAFKYGRNEVTFLRAIALAGDLTSVAKRKKAYIIRKDPTTPTGRQEIQISLASVLNGKSPDLPIQAEDIIFVPGSNGKKALHTLESAPGIITATAVDAAVVH